MKILTDENFKILKDNAQSWVSLLEKMKSFQEGTDSKEMTVDDIVSLISESSTKESVDAAALQTTIDQLTTVNVQQADQIANLTAEVATLKGVPADISGNVSKGGDGTQKEDILTFAAKNPDTAAIMAQAEKENFFYFPKK